MAEADEDIGKYARHPRRTAGAAFLMGVGAGMLAAKMRNDQKPKNGFQKIIDQLGL